MGRTTDSTRKGTKLERQHPGNAKIFVRMDETIETAGLKGAVKKIRSARVISTTRSAAGRSGGTRARVTGSEVREREKEIKEAGQCFGDPGKGERKGPKADHSTASQGE